MLKENIKTLRKAKGYSQEELAIKLNVVRQTISKWEKGLSVPDSELLIKLAEFFEVSVSDLLGNECPISNDNTNEIATCLERINEQLAIRNRRTKTIIRVVVGIVIGFAALIALQALFGMATGRGVETETFMMPQ